MSLNADTEAEFGAIDPAEVKVLEAVPQSHETGNNDFVTPELLFGPEYVNGELPTLDKDFEFQSSETNRLIDLQSIHQSLRVKGLIGLEDAQAIDAVTPGFINDDNPAGYYTEHPSGSNYTESMNTVAASLDSQYEQTKTTLADLATRTATVGKEALHAMRPKYVTALTEINKAILEVMIAGELKSIESAVYSFGGGCRWSKISQISIYALAGSYPDDPEAKYIQEVRGSDFAPYLDRLEEIFKFPDARNNFSDWLDTNTYAVWINRQRYVFAEGHLLAKQVSDDSPRADSNVGNSTIGGLIHQIGTTKVRDWVVQLQNSYQTYVGLVEQIPKQIAELDGQELTTADKLDRVIELNAVLNDARETLMGINRAMGALFQVMCVVKDMMTQLRKAY